MSVHASFCVFVRERCKGCVCVCGGGGWGGGSGFFFMDELEHVHEYLGGCIDQSLTLWCRSSY